MKASGAPEKLYLSKNIYSTYLYQVPDPDDDTTEEYTRTDTFEVKEVDLKNELKEDWIFANKTEVDCLECMCLTEDMFVSLAKKYFELGIKARKGE